MKKPLLSDAIRQAYKRGEDEESMEPIVLCDERGEPLGRIQDGDQVIFYDIRGEREIELTRVFTDSDFRHFERKPGLTTGWATMIEYSKDLPVQIAFPPQGFIKNNLCEVIAKKGFKHAKISESEKAVHVGFFLNGKQKTKIQNEERIVVPSPEDAGNYESTPKMNARSVADETIRCLQDPDLRFMVTNFCNVDVLGHTENKEAILTAVSTVDHELGRVIEEAEKQNVPVLITADHGTVEKYLYPDGAIDTGHTNSRVPFILAAKEKNFKIMQDGGLADVAPTILELLDIPSPSEMTGRSLLKGFSKDRLSKRVLLVILDGWGYNPESHGNLILKADTPVFDRLIRQYPHSFINAAGEAAGLPAETVGNSEVGHLHIGAGRIIPSDKVRIASAIAGGSFFNNPAFVHAMDQAKEKRCGLHLLGIVSFFSSHGSIEYCLALLEMARRRGLKNVYVHGLLGRRGERPESGAYYIRKIEEECEKLGTGQVVSVIGRHWALDREDNWARIEKTYRMLVYGEGVRYTS